MTINNKIILKDILLLMAVIALIYSTLLGSRQLTVPDEGRYSEIPRQMLLHHDYVTPRINNIKYFEKPPLFYWLQTASVKAFGLNEWSVRIMTALMGLIGCVLTYFAGTQLFDRRTAILSAMTLASSGLYLGMSRFVTLDMTVSVFISASLLSFLLYEKTNKPNYLYAMYVAAALATLTKGFIGFILPGGIIFCWILATNNWRKLKDYRLFTGALLFLVIALPWHILAQIRNPEFLRYYVLDQQILRYFTSISDRGQAIWFLPGVLIAGLLPWTPWLPQAVHFAWRKFKTERDTIMLMLLIWPTLTFFFFWFSKSQLSPYILPMFPPIALMMAHYFSERFDNKQSQWPNYLALWICIAIISTVATIKFSFSDISILISVAIMITGTLISTFLYKKRYFIEALTALALGFSLFVVSLNLSLPKYDTRSIKPLALTMKRIMRPGDILASYNFLYLDLPVYLNHNVTIVNFYGELKYNIQHQNVSDVWIGTDDYWRLWQSNKRRILMIMKIDDYVNYIGQNYYKMFVIAKTDNAVLISNREVSL